MEKEKPRLINGKVTDGYIGDALFVVKKQPSLETIEYLNNFFTKQILKECNKCLRQ